MFDFLRHRSAATDYTSKRPLRIESLEQRDMMSFGVDFAIGDPSDDNSQIATASAPDGSSVAVWTVRHSSGDTDIVGQLFDTSGNKNGGIFNIMSGSTRDSDPAVAMNADGDFAVSFTREHNFGFLNLGVDQDVRVRRVNANGGVVGGSIAVSSTSNSELAFDSDIAVDASGDFVVSYTSQTTKTRTATNIFGFRYTESFTDRDVRARRFNENGTAQGGTFGVDTTSTTFEDNSSVAIADDGRFVIAYENGNDIHARRFNSNGTLRGIQVIANSNRTETNPDVAVDAVGNAVVVWQDTTNGGDIKGRRLSDGGTLGTILTIRGTTSGESVPSVALESDGDAFVVGYNRIISSGGLVANRIDATRVERIGTADVIQSHETLGQGMTAASVSVGDGFYFLGYDDFIDDQVRGRFGSYDFRIDLTLGNGLNAAQQAIFRQAADRWEEVITGDLPGQFVNLNGVSTYVDDLRINAQAVPIDGVGNVAGSAGPGQLRDGSSLPLTGAMNFDTADLANLQSDGRLFDVIVHEMGHVLGIGTIWDDLNLITGAGTNNPLFTGAGATAEYNALRGIWGIIAPASAVPVANTGGAGTADAHWRESIFGAELMTGFLESAGTTMPISRMTVASLADLGYTVNMGAAEAYTLPSQFIVARTFSGGITGLGGSIRLDSGDDSEVRQDQPDRKEDRSDSRRSRLDSFVPVQKKTADRSELRGSTPATVSSFGQLGARFMPIRVG